MLIARRVRILLVVWTGLLMRRLLRIGGEVGGLSERKREERKGKEKEWCEGKRDEG
jgi:hypothetical protein